MKKLVLLAAVTVYCCETKPAVVPHYQDVVKFRFTGENAFYAKACEDKAVVIGQLSSGDEYHLLLKCGTLYRPIWVKADDIVSVLSKN
jgi:hypothetical protein